MITRRRHSPWAPRRDLRTLHRVPHDHPQAQPKGYRGRSHLHASHLRQTASPTGSSLPGRGSKLPDLGPRPIRRSSGERRLRPYPYAHPKCASKPAHARWKHGKENLTKLLLNHYTGHNTMRVLRRSGSNSATGSPHSTRIKTRRRRSFSRHLRGSRCSSSPAHLPAAGRMSPSRPRRSPPASRW